MNDPDWLRNYNILQGNFTSILSFGGAAPDLPARGGLPKVAVTPPDPPCSEYFTGGIAAPLQTGVQCGDTFKYKI